jgi:hypothetical protein
VAGSKNGAQEAFSAPRFKLRAAAAVAAAAAAAAATAFFQKLGGYAEAAGSEQKSVLSRKVVG